MHSYHNQKLNCLTGSYINRVIFFSVKGAGVVEDKSTGGRGRCVYIVIVEHCVM